MDGAPLVLFEGYDTPEKARELNGWLVQVPQEEAVPLPDGQYYWFELIGLEVVTESGEKLGRVVDIFETGSNDVYVVKAGKKEIYLPATREIIKQVDRAAKRMVIHVVDGLLD
jgi:16S rRNA processing protein RimM